MNGLQLGLKGLLERSADGHRFVPVGSARGIAEVIPVIFELIV